MENIPRYRLEPGIKRQRVVAGSQVDRHRGRHAVIIGFLKLNVCVREGIGNRADLANRAAWHVEIYRLGQAVQVQVNNAGTIPVQIPGAHGHAAADGGRELIDLRAAIHRKGRRDDENSQ